MASYGYEAIDRTGKTVKGSVQADDQDKARADLRGQGLTVVTMTEQSALNKDINIQFKRKPSARDLSVFCNQFVAMNRAGVSILDSLRMLADATENVMLKEAIEGVRVSTEKGETLASSMEQYPKVFPSIMIHMVAAGEASGSLDVSLQRVGKQFETTSKTQALVKKAMIYPIVVLLVAIAVVIVMLVVVIPRYAEMFADLGSDLPGITKAVMRMSEFIQARWWLILIVVAALVTFFKSWSKTLSGQHALGKLAMMIPAVKNMVVKSASAQMARTLSTLIGSGVPLVEGVGITSTIMSNIWFKEALEDAKAQIMVGKPLSAPLEDCGLFPPMVYYMVRIGEETGNTEDMLDKLADYYEEEVEMAVASLMAAMEPMIIIVLAGVVGVLIGACMAPMLKMYQDLGNL
ncbi:MAG: type II secretion system F family protein [Lachnospiraceae bacterium]|nr:type II secretion system F family protein [Lachnospiraceae bacterium]